MGDAPAELRRLRPLREIWCDQRITGGACHGPDSELAKALGRDFKGRISVVIYAAGIGLAFVQSWIAIAPYVSVALLWLVPDRRIERELATRVGE